MTRVWELDLGHAQQAVLLSMADHANDEGAEVFPSTGLIAWKSGYSKRQVQRIIDGMEECGLLERVAEAHGWRAVEYRINFGVVPVKEPYEPSRKGRGDRTTPQECQGDAPEGRQDDAPVSAANSAEMSPPGATFATGRGDTAMSSQGRHSCVTQNHHEPSKEPPKEPSSEKESTPSLLSRGELVELSNRLADEIRRRDGKAKVRPKTVAWLDPLRLLLDRDGRSVQEVEGVIDWCLADEFEHRVVLSPSKLRARFDELALKAGVAQPAPGTLSFDFRRRPRDGAQPPRQERQRCPAESEAWLAEHPSTDALAAEWAPIAAQLEQMVGDATYNIWLAQLHPHAASEEEFVVGGPGVAADWVRNRFGRVLNAAAGRPVRLVACGCKQQPSEQVAA